MNIHTSFEHIKIKNAAVAIGIFDGVHLGHNSILNALIDAAKRKNGESMVITFWPHPRIVLGKEKGLKFITSISEKKYLLEKKGIDHLLILPFSREFSKLSACDFLENYLIKKISLKTLVSGFNHQFGHQGEGKKDKLNECASTHQFEHIYIDEIKTGANSISSTKIRSLIENGNVSEASTFLGYHYMLRGLVVSGKQIGRKIGFPTANILPEDEHKLIPKDGVYSVMIKVGEEKYKGMLNIGVNPTIEENLNKTIEVNIFNLNKSIYNEQIELSFVSRLRDELKFNSLEELVNQLKIDQQSSLEALKEISE